MQRGETAEEEKLERNEETEVNGVDEMSDGEGDEIDGEDWRVRAGPSNKPTQRERGAHQNNQVPYRKQDARTTQRRFACHTMLGGARQMHPVQLPERS